MAHPSSPVLAPVSDERFWSHVDKSGECWTWTGYRDRQGYGRLMRDGKNWLAHRWVYQLEKGEPQGVIRHTCDNPPCVNPDHLLDGSQADNIRDRQLRGRHRPGRLSGEAHPGHKLTRDQVVEIRALWRWGVSVKVLAAQYGVHYATAYMIVTGQTWKEVA